MVKAVKVQYAKTHLSAILAEVEAGAEVIISRGDTPVARLAPIAQLPGREWGFVPYRVPSSFFDPLPPSELEAWEE
ncbi:type II toxin-antitoxin system Phd/YefM family antitoxin [Saxibacter everestensis]|uniref:Antitoxin n=1 Tax=Saxibacter everestensis TaxID=2909229 RepID=A0ABY8QQ84_9MICO|nr:type II toxin-antitoxin system Phd/YefM family antitoxin [Brevibacteriaceae bacterium ZFBP1038]